MEHRESVDRPAPPSGLALWSLLGGNDLGPVMPSLLIKLLSKLIETAAPFDDLRARVAFEVPRVIHV